MEPCRQLQRRSGFEQVEHVENLRQMRGQYQKLLDPKNPYAGKRSAANRAAIDAAPNDARDPACARK